MKVVILNGSPKDGDGASQRISRALARTVGRLSDGPTITLGSPGLGAARLAESLEGAGALALVFPLYVDGLPSHLVDLLEGLPAAGLCGLTVYAVLNNGFWEARHNALALDILRHFCRQKGLRWGQGLAWGGGGLIPHLSGIGRFPFKVFLQELELLSVAMMKSASGPDRFSQPSVPRFFYKASANLMWYLLALKNRIGLKTLFRRLDG
ncbi:MAG: hypothetical protein LBP92_07970 [Deltaproteobacteria bacterium]|jgi:hypothetical protein|nr:hypothetical protein [Deltaproteobacteria bacterium]